MSNSPIEREPGREQKVRRYRRFRRAQKTAEQALGELTVEQAWQGQTAESLINVKDRLEQATIIIRRDLKGLGKKSKS